MFPPGRALKGGSCGFYLYASKQSGKSRHKHRKTEARLVQGTLALDRMFSGHSKAPVHPDQTRFRAQCWLRSAQASVTEQTLARSPLVSSGQRARGSFQKIPFRLRSSPAAPGACLVVALTIWRGSTHPLSL